MKFPTSALILAPAIGVMLIAPAHAYLDPGTGSILLQGLLGGVAGGLFLVRMQWARLKGWFSRSRAPGE